MDLNEIAVFLKIVTLGSFSKAGRALGMPNSTVSAKLSALEKRLGLTLIQRTTRKLTVTPVGQTYFERCAAGLKEFEAAELQVRGGDSQPRGVLRLTAPVEMGLGILPVVLAEFIKAYPLVSVETVLTDRQVHLIDENIDLALRAGHLKDSSMVVRKITDVRFAIFAAPRFLRERGLPKTPRDVHGFECIRFAPLGTGPWVLTDGNLHERVSLKSRLTVNDLNFSKVLATQGLGLALLPTFLCVEEVRAGTLRHVLPTWHSQVAPLQFVYPAQKYVPSHVTAFTQLALTRLRELLG